MLTCAVIAGFQPFVVRRHSGQAAVTMVRAGVWVGRGAGGGSVTSGARAGRCQPGMGVPVVLVHGLRVSGSMWRPQMEVLCAEGRRVVAPDLPGHGGRRGEVFTLDGAVEAVHVAVDEVGGRALVVGLSLGGFVSILAAAADPARVAGLVAASCTARPAQALAHVYRIPTALLERLPDKGEAVNERFHRMTLRGSGAEAVLDGGLAVEAARAVIDEVADVDVLGALRSYAGPVWLVNGARDHFRIHERRFVDACVDGRLVNVPRAGHMVSLDQPDNFAKLVADAADVVTVREFEAVEGRMEEPPSPA